MISYTDIANRLKQKGIDQYDFITVMSLDKETRLFKEEHNGISVFCQKVLLEKRKEEIQLLLSDMNVKIYLDKNREEIIIELLK